MECEEMRNVIMRVLSEDARFIEVGPPPTDMFVRPGGILVRVADPVEAEFFVEVTPVTNGCSLLA